MDARELIVNPPKNNNYAGNLNEKDKKALAFVLAEYYKKKVRKKPVEKKVKKKKLVKNKVSEPQLKDDGPTDLFYLTFLLGNISGFVLLFVITWLGAAVMITASIISIYLANNFRRTRRVYVSVEKEVEVEVEEIVKGPEFEEIVMPATDKVIAIGRMSIQFKAIKVKDDKCIVLGPHELMGKKNVSYPYIREGEKVLGLIKRMRDELAEVPFILDGEKGVYTTDEKTAYGEEVVLRGYEKQLRDCFNEMEELTADISETPFPVPWMNVKPLLYHLEATKQKDQTHSLFEHNAHIINVLANYINAGFGLYMENALNAWLDTWNKNNGVLHGVRYTSLVNKVAPVSLDLSNSLQYSAFNFYCPGCNRDISEEMVNRDYSVQQNEITPPVIFSKNSKCVYNPGTQLWRCPTCETDTTNPIPIHKTLDEILMPAFDRLMDENKNRRLKAHDDIRTREIDNTNEMEKEIERAFYDQLTHIYSLSDEMERMKAEIMGENEAVKSILEVADTYNYKQSRVMEMIHDDCERINAEIIERTNNVIADMDRYKDEQMALLAKELHHLSKVKRVEDEKRDAVQRKILQANRETTQAVKTGFRETVSAINKQTDVLGEKIDHQTNTLGEKIDRQTDVVGEKLDRGNAIQAAVAKKQGVNTRDHSWWRLDKVVKDVHEDIVGGLTGRSSVDTEMAKMRND